MENTLKSSVAFLYVNHFFEIKHVPTKLNILIRPLLSYLNNEKYIFFSKLNAETFLKLTLIFEAKTQSPIPRVLKNIIGSMNESIKVKLFYGLTH